MKRPNARRTAGTILQKTDRPIWNIMHPISHILDLAPSLLSLFDHLTDDFGNVKTVAAARCIARNAESISFRTAMNHFLGAPGMRVPRRVATSLRYMKCAEKYLVTNFQIFEVVILRMPH